MYESVCERELNGGDLSVEALMAVHNKPQKHVVCVCVCPNPAEMDQLQGVVINCGWGFLQALQRFLMAAVGVLLL